MSKNKPELLFPTTCHLQEWLDAHDIDTGNWGQADAKTLPDLWQELQHGESVLQADPPLRCVRVVEVIISRGTELLVEAEQHFVDGRVRVRNRPPSEKLYPDEDPVAAARRCLQEELSVAPSAISFPCQELIARTVREQSSSYPNLTSEYTFYVVHANVNGLPPTDFTTLNSAHDVGDPIVAHHWVWVSKTKDNLS